MTELFQEQFAFWDNLLLPISCSASILLLALSSGSIWTIGIILAWGTIDTVVSQGLKRFILPRDAHKHVEYMMIRGLMIGLAMSAFYGWHAVWCLYLSSLAVAPIFLVVITVMSLLRSLCRNLFFLHRGWLREQRFSEISMFEALKVDLSDWASLVALGVCMTVIFLPPTSSTVSLFYFLSQTAMVQALSLCCYMLGDVIFNVSAYFIVLVIGLVTHLLNWTLFHPDVPWAVTDLVLMACMLYGGYAWLGLTYGVPVASILFLLRSFIFVGTWHQISVQPSHWARFCCVLRCLVQPIRSSREDAMDAMVAAMVAAGIKDQKVDNIVKFGPSERQATHLASIHATTAFSAMRLSRKFEQEEKFNGLHKKYEVVTTEILAAFVAWKAENSAPIVDAEWKNLGADSIQKYCHRLTESDFIEGRSRITLPKAFALTWFECKTCIENEKYQAYKPDILKRYFSALKESYHICPSGAFNKLIASLRGVSDKCEVRVISFNAMYYGLVKAYHKSVREFIANKIGSEVSNVQTFNEMLSKFQDYLKREDREEQRKEFKKLFMANADEQYPVKEDYTHAEIKAREKVFNEGYDGLVESMDPPKIDYQQLVLMLKVFRKSVKQCIDNKIDPINFREQYSNSVKDLFISNARKEYLELKDLKPQEIKAREKAIRDYSESLKHLNFPDIDDKELVSPVS